jgi:aminomethyltransferase
MGVFDVSHMGRFVFRGRGAVRFLQHVLSSNVDALDVGEAHYTLIPTETGGAVDDAYLSRFVEDEYLLVVNAANRPKDWDYLQRLVSGFDEVEALDRTEALIMLALQGPESRALLRDLVDDGRLPEPRRNALGIVTISGGEVWVARTGYTGEPLCFELFADPERAGALWDLLVARGATPVGLGARDTLRLEAGLPLYGHELGTDAEGKEIPVFACPSARSSVSFSPRKDDFVGRAALKRQHEACLAILSGYGTHGGDLPRLIQPLAIQGTGIARSGARARSNGRDVGYVTSGTMVPYWVFESDDIAAAPSDESDRRAICLALLDSSVREGDEITVEARGREVPAVVVPYHLRSEAPPYARPIVYGRETQMPTLPAVDYPERGRRLLHDAAENSLWRQRECINLIPSEMTLSPMARLLSVMDPAFRYAEHRQVKALYDAEVFYYQGTGFIAEVERLLEQEMRKFLGCHEVECRLISGQMANMAVYSGIVDHLNEGDRKREPRRISSVMRHHIGKGGHLSAQPMGALRDYVAHEARTERPAVIDIPVLPDNPYRTDVPSTLRLLDRLRPKLVVFGKSMVLHKEPVAEIREFLDRQSIESLVMYDMAHVLGLIGPHFQEPFEEGADLVTGSTHKTFFGTQRGVIGSSLRRGEQGYELWEAIRRRSFPGSVSNHHLGTLVGLLMAAYEMSHFRDEYQQSVIANAKAFARALRECGLDVAGDSAVGFTETHQVIVEVGYRRGPEIAGRLEDSNVICNYQATPEDEGFTASGALRLGVAEMTRFGMAEEDFQHLASLVADVVLKNANVVEQVKALRRRFLDLRFCFSGDEYSEALQMLHSLL